jgi:hypothetical protein
MFRRLDILFAIVRRRPASWLALAGQFVALFGLPLPTVTAKDLANPFPCQHRKCGCMCAADCWDNCCCFSARERLAWAREHHAQVPSSLTEQARQSEKNNPGACCDLKNKSSTRDGSTPGGAVGFMARQCHGEHTAWGCGEPAPVPAPLFCWILDDPSAGWCLTSSWRVPFANHIPPVPPPRS